MILSDICYNIPMTKKQLYIVIGVLGAGLLYVFFMPVDTSVEQEPPRTVTPNLAEESEVPEVTVTEKENDELQDEEEQVVLEGIFLSLADGTDKYDKKFRYLLLNDGSEVLRIDLRPLVGYSDINVLQKLGVVRGERVTVTGYMKEGVFTAQEIE